MDDLKRLQISVAVLAATMFVQEILLWRFVHLAGGAL